MMARDTALCHASPQVLALHARIVYPHVLVEQGVSVDTWP
jgi:hypothetical protein